MNQIVTYIYTKHDSEFLIELVSQDRKQIKVWYIKNKYKNALEEKLRQRQAS